MAAQRRRSSGYLRASDDEPGRARPLQPLVRLGPWKDLVGLSVLGEAALPTGGAAPESETIPDAVTVRPVHGGLEGRALGLRTQTGGAYLCGSLTDSG